MAKDRGVAEEYSSSLADLTVNSKPLINMLTMLAEDYIEHSPTIVRTVEAHLQKVPGDIKLPVLYLIDSIVKNVGKDYVSLFTQNIVSTFCAVFEQVDEKTRSQMFKLRQTWNDVFPSKKLYALDARVHSIDPAWPITAPPPTPRIHVNPKFLNTVPSTPTEPTTTALSTTNLSASSLSTITDTAMREELLKKQKELLELQKRKVELELLQTKAILEEQQKKLENQTATRISENPTAPSPTKGSKHKTRVDVSEEPVNKPKSLEAKPEKTKFEGTKRRDPRLHSRKESDPRLRPRKETQQSLQGSISKLPVPTKDLHKEESKYPSSDDKKITESSSNNGGSKHQRKKGDRYSKKHRDNKEHKPRMKVLFGDSPENRESDTLRNVSKKLPSKQNDNEVSAAINTGNIKDELVTNKNDFPQELPSSENVDKDFMQMKKELKEEQLEGTGGLPEPFKNNESHSQPKRVEPIIHQPTIDVPQNTQDNESIPMEIDEKPIDKCEPKPIVPENISAVFNIDEPAILKSLKESDGTIFPPESKTSDLAVNSCGDTDLRLLPPQSNSDTEQPPEKKSKSDIPKLFGEEDVDLRKSFVPLPPPPPIISSYKSDSTHSEGWANFKRSNSDRGSSGKSPKKRKSVVSSPRSSCFRKKEEESSRETIEQDTEDRQNSLVLIMKDAEEQLKNGTITYAQYNQMLKGVMSMNEENKLQEAIMKDDFERIDSPESGSNSSTDVQHHFDDHLESQDSYRPQNTSGEGKPLSDENLSEQSKHLNDPRESNDHESGRRRSRYKNNEQYGRSKGSRHGRYYNPNEPVFYPDNNKPWIGRQQQSNFPHRSRKEMGNRWQYSHNRQKPADYPVAVPPNMRMRGPRHHQEISLPPADPTVLDIIDSDPMAYVTVGNSTKEVRFYGENAIVMVEWDDPRDLMFQPGSRRVFIDGDVLTLQFNSSYREYTLNSGMRIRIRLGAPTRELFIDGRFYEAKFGGPPIEVNLGGRTHLIQLEGPMPFLSVGQIKRTDLVAGKVNLIVDGKIENLFPIYLDSKAQRFEINGVPFIIRFVESLQTVVINGQPMKIPFGGIPIPIFFRGERHYLRLTTLPPNITPGFVNIANMEGGRLPTPPPPRLAPPPPMINDIQPPLAPPSFMNPQHKNYEFPGNKQPPFPGPAEFPQYSVSTVSGSDKPVDVLTSLMPPPVPRFVVQNYQVEPYQEAPPTSAPSETPFNTGSLIPPSIDVIELYQKLVAMGVVPKEKKEKEKEEPEDNSTIKPVDFSKPETLKLKQPGLINTLYSGIQCSSCGVRFSPEQTVKYSQHLDWHFRQNRRERHSTRIAQSRKWNYDVSDWIQYQEIEDDEDRAQSWFEIQDKKAMGEEEEDSLESTVPAKGFGENPCCTVCRDRFDQFFNEDKEEWQLRRAVCVEDKLYHPLCLKDEQESQGRELIPAMMPVPEEEPIVTIDLDAAGDSGEEEKANADTNLDTIEIESSSKSPQEPDPMDADTEPPTEEPEKAESAEVDKPAEEKTEDLDIAEKEQKSPQQEDVAESKEDTAAAEDSDDDIIAIEVIEPQIESYDILDDDDEEELETQKSAEKDPDLNEEKKEMSDGNNSELEEMRTDIVIKTEPIDLINTNSNTGLINETIHLDGNSEFSAPKILLPKKIKINISSIVNKQNDDPSNNMANIIHDENSNDNAVAYDYTEPLPPGEEPLFTGHLKPHLIGKRMSERPLVNKGKEMSGLCTIM